MPHLKPGADYDDLYQSALCRAQADWLVGINATRLFSILYHKTLTVGRVQTPTLNMLVDREAKISNFKKEKYHVVHIAAGGMEAASDRFMNPDDADATKTACAGAQAVCVSVKREKKTEQPPPSLRSHHLCSGRPTACLDLPPSRPLIMPNSSMKRSC